MTQSYIIVRPDFVDMDGMLDDIGYSIFVEEAGTDYPAACTRADELTLEMFRAGFELRVYFDFAGEEFEANLRTTYARFNVPLDNVWSVPALAAEEFYQAVLQLIGRYFYYVKNKNAADINTVRKEGEHAVQRDSE